MNEEMEEGLDLGRYVSTLRKWYRLILVAAVLAGGTALVVSFRLPPTYEAEADVAVVTSGATINFDTKIQTITGLDSAQLDQANRLKAFTRVAQSTDIAAAVIAKLGNQLSPSEQMPENLVKSIKATTDGSLIRITASADSPEKAALIANSWANEYARRVNSVYVGNPLSPTEIQLQADAAQRDYTQKEAALLAYLAQSAGQVAEITKQKAAKEQQLSDMYAALNKYQRLLVEAQSLKTRVAAGSDSGASATANSLALILLQASTFTTGAGLPVNLQIPMDQLTDLNASPAQQGHDLDALIETLSSKIKETQLSVTLGYLQNDISQLQAQVEQENSKKQELTRARDLAWSTYTTLASKSVEVNLSSQTGGNVVQLATQAVAPLSPVSPKKALNTLLGGLVGLMLGAGVAFLLEYMNDSVTSEDQVAALLSLPTIGVVSEIPKVHTNGRGPQKGHALVTVENPRSAVTEGFRVLCYNLFLDGNSRKVVLVASALPSEGKSTIAANLAALIAQTGKRVTLVDANLRRPSQHKLFGLKNGSGLYNLLTEEVGNWETYAQSTNVEGLKLVSAGPLPRDPAGLLASSKLEQLVKVLKSASDVVIIDAPAVLGLADAAILSRAADGILMVAESDRVSRKDALRAKQVLAATGIPILGVVLNRAARSIGASMYEYYTAPKPDVPASTNGHKGFKGAWDRAQNEWLPELRDRVVDFVGPRRGG